MSDVLPVLRDLLHVAERGGFPVTIAADSIRDVIKELQTLQIKASASLANNLCSDHFDKQVGKPCLACEIERLQAHLLTAINERDMYARQRDEARDDAAKWRALRNCSRITSMGSAGCQPGGPSFDGPTAHLTLNFWTHNERETETYPRAWLDTFVEKARRLLQVT